MMEETEQSDPLVIKFKEHIHFEEGMEDSMLFFYLEMAKKYVMTATGGQAEYLILMIAGIAYEYRIAEEELSQAMDAMTPFFVQGAVNSNGEESNE